MSYKRYIKRNGKIYGPYEYSSRREDGKVLSIYHGKEESKEKKPARPAKGEKTEDLFLDSSLKLGRFLFLAVILALFTISLFGQAPLLTGKLSWEITTQGQFDLGNYTNTSYNASGYIQLDIGNSTAYYAGQVLDANYTASWDNITWDEYLPPDTNLSFQVRSDADNSSWGIFLGPDGTSSTYYTTAAFESLNVTPNRYFQFRAFFETTDLTNTSRLYNVTIGYKHNSTIHVSNCTTLNEANKVYVLTQNANSAGDCFTLAANNITLDCQGNSINGTDVSTSSGIIATNDDFTIENCNILNWGGSGYRYGGIYGGESDGGSNGIVRNNNISSCVNAINFRRGSNTNTFSNNTIFDNGAGVRMGTHDVGVNSDNLFSNNNFSSNTYGILYWNHGSAIVEGSSDVINNIFHDNTYSFYIEDSVINNVFFKNNVTDSTYGIYIQDDSNTGDTGTNISYNNFFSGVTYTIYNNAEGDITAEYNWFGTVECAEVEGMIYDYKDNAAKGLVDYSPLLNASWPGSSSGACVDTIPPYIIFGSGTDINNTNVTRNWIYINVTVNETHEANITFNLYNSLGSLVNSTINTTPQQRTINWTSLSQDRYYYNVTVYDTTGNSNSTETRILTYNTTIEVSSCSNLAEENMIYLLTQNVSSTGTCFNITAHNITLNCGGYMINGTDAGSSYGVQPQEGIDYFNISNCNIMNYDSGIYLGKNVQGSRWGTIDRNNFSSCDEGIYGYRSTNDNDITNNNFNYNNKGIYFTTCQAGTTGNNQVLNNTFSYNDYGVYAKTVCLAVSGSNDYIENIFINNTYAFYIKDILDEIIKNNNITNSTYGIYFYGTQAITGTNVSYNNFLSGVTYTIYNSQADNITAEYNWLGTVSCSAINASVYDYYDNVGVGVVDYSPVLDAPYPSGQPTNCPQTCGTVNRNFTLENNVNSSATCFGIAANNIVLDCAGYTINYSQSSEGYAISNSGYDNVTIKNCLIEQGGTISNSNAIMFSGGASNGTIINNSITTSDYGAKGIRLTSSANYNNLTGNSITTSGNYADGIYIYLSSEYNTLTSNNITTSGSDAKGIILDSSTDNTLTSNNITTSGSDAYSLYFEGTSINNNISYNNIYSDQSYYLYNNQANNITVENNWWNTTNCSVIESRIYENPGTVDYEPFLDDSYPEGSSRGCDITPPTVSLSCSPSTVEIGEAVTCSCSASDNLDDSLNYSYSLTSSTSSTSTPSTLSEGIFTEICTVIDDASNSNSASDSFTVNPLPGGGEEPEEEEEEPEPDECTPSCGSCIYEGGMCDESGLQSCIGGDCIEYSGACTRDTNGISCGAGKTCSSGTCENIPCDDDCSEGSSECIASSSYHICGDYDSDVCSEWSSPISCDLGEMCSSGVCEPCIESWSCGDWDVCLEHSQYRDCSDANGCETFNSQPDEEQGCNNIPILISALPNNPSLDVCLGTSLSFSINVEDWDSDMLTATWSGGEGKTESSSSSIDSSYSLTASTNSSVSVSVSEDYPEGGSVSKSWDINVICGGEEEEEECFEEWSCEWGECQEDGYRYAENCVDGEDCGTTLLKPYDEYCGTIERPERTVEAPSASGGVGLSCIPKWDCTEWGECIIFYDIKGEIKTRQTQSCTDSKGCQPDKVKEIPCKKEIPVIVERVEDCFESHIKVYNEETGKLIANIKEEVARAQPGMDIVLSATEITEEEFCEYCFDNIQNYDETYIDCGGPSCPVCKLGDYTDWLIGRDIIFKDLNEGDVIYFSIQTIQHSLTVEKINLDKGTIELTINSPESINLVLQLEEIKKVDVNEDEETDISIILNDIIEEKAKITLKKLSVEKGKLKFMLPSINFPYSQQIGSILLMILMVFLLTYLFEYFQPQITHTTKSITRTLTRDLKKISKIKIKEFKIPKFKIPKIKKRSVKIKLKTKKKPFKLKLKLSLPKLRPKIKKKERGESVTSLEKDVSKEKAEIAKLEREIKDKKEEKKRGKERKIGKILLHKAEKSLSDIDKKLSKENSEINKIEKEIKEEKKKRI